MTRPTRALLKWDNLRHNYRKAREATRHEAYAVIKSDGYGHGMLACANALSGEADGFAVACVDEALTLRQAGIRQPILVLEGAYDPEEWTLASKYHLQLAVHHPQQLKDKAEADLSDEVAVWLKVSSGMNRLGVKLEDAPEMIARIRNDNDLILRHVMSHFATSDEADTGFYQQQIATMTEHAWPVPLSLSNSASVIRGGIEQERVLRPGIMLYGSSPCEDISAAEAGLKPVMTLQSALISTHTVKAGETVGYGCTWTAPRDSRIGVVAIGYGDGYPRHAPSGTPVNVAGQRCELVGRVSMDMITVDITDAPEAGIGSPVELWGELVSIDEVAGLANTISYELFCRLTKRVPRVNLQ
ncbi:MAG: alanine racemase [Thalassolituus sp.]|jgi:alanine racemase|nr:alanine racemase [Pseudomonadota bacterium]MEC8102312.1 alanine racemase [Pseudomonadota bacterium]MEC8524523.1 alanine racemase [Pseudomonadota bacterium]MEE2748931.1 alanine racemase [Pseudomonadota bacterium]TNC84796.1 MAG: alanine racemase [Thalassolituus sp.]